MKKLIQNTTNETYCVRHCCQDTPKRAVHAEGGAILINTDVKSEDTEIADTRNHRQSRRPPDSYLDTLIKMGSESIEAIMRRRGRSCSRNLWRA